MKILLFFFFLINAIEITASQAQEKIFANYFDIKVNSPEKTEVVGRIHLERNKDVLTNPIPRTYRFAITRQNNDLFSVETKFDPMGRIMGILRSTKKIDDKWLGTQQLSIVLMEGQKQIKQFPITIHIVKKTLLQTMYERYKDRTVSNEGSHMYGRRTFSDSQVADIIAELEANKGRFKKYSFYNQSPVTYKPVGKKIEYDWEDVAKNIGAMGYAYAMSKTYGPDGNMQAREQLKRAIYSAIIAYTEAIPVEGTEVTVNGKPIGPYTGDGFVLLDKMHIIEHQVATHQWVITDALITPAVQLMPEMVEEITKGDKQAERVYYGLIRAFQNNMAEVEKRRDIYNSDRWGNLTDTLRNAGAWADANLGHRSRAMLALPIIWADYNRPQTYVQYWYSDFYKNKPFKNFSFSYPWSPSGIITDVSYWLTKYNTSAHAYAQSGFQPDGTVSHHVDNATDLVMVAYGFEILTNPITGFNQFKNSDFKLADKYYQFPADRLEKIYPQLIYKGRIDFLASGRDYRIDLKNWVSNTYLSAIKNLLDAKSESTQINNETTLNQVKNDIKKGSHQQSGTTAFWVNEYLVHRQGSAGQKPFYASLKLKSKRTVGAEDFEKTRKSWYMGYGILPLKVTGDEYNEKVLSNMDWHALPGLTEEWRTDAMPGGHSQASLPGNNIIGGVTSNGTDGLAIYHHLPGETYSAATAHKSYYFIDDKIISIGSNIRRLRPGQQKDIVTTVDQSALIQPLTIFVDGKTETIQPGQSVNKVYNFSTPIWLHTGEKGYIVFPDGKQQLVVKTGKEINITDTGIANDTPNYIISINHGTNPDNAGYFYALLPNVTDKDMPLKLATYQKQLQYQKLPAVHGLTVDGTLGATFFDKAEITLGGIKISAESPALAILKDEGSKWKLTLSNPVPSINQQQLILHTSLALKPGKYNYQLGGIYPRQGEYVTIIAEGSGSKIIAELPDKRDDAFYDNKAELYNAAPVTIEIGK